MVLATSPYKPFKQLSNRVSRFPKNPSCSLAKAHFKDWAFVILFKVGRRFIFVKRVSFITSFIIFLFARNATAQVGGPAFGNGAATGNIITCAGMPSASPYIQQFVVFGNQLTTDMVVSPPAYFEVSLSPLGGYTSSVSITPVAGKIDNTTIYVRLAANAPPGTISGQCMITTSGFSSLNPIVTGTVFNLPNVNNVPNQTVITGAATAAINFTGSGGSFSWVNNTPGIGLAASGTGNIASFKAVNNGVAPVKATITITPSPPGMAFVASSVSNNVSVINMATNAVVATIPVDDNPFGVTFSPDGKIVYVTCANGISVISTATDTVVYEIPTSPNPHGIAVSPDGNKLYVTYASYQSFFSVVDVPAGTVKNIQSPNFNYGIAISPDGSRVYMANNIDNALSVISTATNTVIAVVPTGLRTYGVAVSPDGSRVYVTNSDSNNVSVIDASTNTVIATVTTGTSPNSIAISPDGSRIYVTNQTDNTVSVINTASDAVVSTIKVGLGPFGISVTPDGKDVYVVNFNSGNVSVISTAANAVTATIAVGTSPEAFGNFITAGSGCSGLTGTFTITVNPGTFPVITPTSAPSAVNTTYGTASAASAFTVSGTNLVAGILVTPPPGFEVSADNFNFSNAVTVGRPGTIASITVYIRLAAATAAGNYTGNIVLSSPSAANVNVVMPVSTVNPANLTVTADNKSKMQGQVNPVLTVTYSGFKNSDGTAQLTARPAITTTAVTASPAGQYPISASGAASANYTFIYIAGILTIIPAPQIPNTFTPNGDGVNDVWNIKSLSDYPECTVAVYSRYGGLIYQSTGYTRPWDGTINGGAVPVGTYYYIINLQNGSNQFTGFITVIR